MKGLACSWIPAGLAAGLLLGAADVLALVQARELFFSNRELGLTAAMVVGICAAAGVIAALFLAGIVEFAAWLIARISWQDKPLKTGLGIAAVVCGLFVPIFWRLTAGPQASQLPARPLLVVLAAALAGLASSAALVGVRHWSADRPGRRRAVGLAGLVAAILLHLLDLNVLVRLYPLFHYTLTALALAAGILGLRRWLAIPGKKRIYLAISAVAFVALATGGIALHSVRAQQNPRYVIGDRTAVAADLVALVAWLKPPPVQQALDADLPPEELEGQATTPGAPAVVRPGADVILLTVDAMRYDRLALLDPRPNPPRRPTPNLDRLAAQSVVFSRTYTPAPHTSYAISSLLTGKYTAMLFDVPGAPPMHETWPEILHRFRYDTAAFFSPAVFFIDRQLFEPYLRSGCHFKHRRIDYLIPPEERVDQVIEYLEERTDHSRPVFIWTHFFDPHEPYDPTCTLYGHTPEERYDCELNRVDTALGRLLAYLQNGMPQAIIIATSDHGEEFGDHGGRYHGTTLFDEQVRVPLAIRVPGLDHRIVDAPVGLVDLVGTVLRLLDLPLPARIRSRDLTPLLVGAPGGPDQAFAQRENRAMVVAEKHKLICELNEEVCRLYDLTTDPKETRSITSREPVLAARLRRRLRAWQESHARTELRPVEVADPATKESWPGPVQQVIAGDDSALPGLLTILGPETEHPQAVRRKAAELLRRHWGKRPLTDLPLVGEEKDPEVAAWLAVLHLESGKPVAAAALIDVLAELEQMSPVWRAAVLALLEGNDRSQALSALEIALEKDAPLAQRAAALDLIMRGEKPLPAKLRKVLAQRLPRLLDEYQLTLDAARALGRLASPSTIPALAARLTRERFLDRRAALIAALAATNHSRAIPPIAAELVRDGPPPGTLAALVKLGAAKPRGRHIGSQSSRGSGTVLIWAPAPTTVKLSSPSKLERVDRIVLAWRASGDGGHVQVWCGGEKQGQTMLLDGENEGTIEIEWQRCQSALKAESNLELRLVPEDREAVLTALAAVRID